jgi:GDPmannose 4,6-dehydratase
MQWNGSREALGSIVSEFRPSEFYNLAAMTRGSAKDEELSLLVEANGLSVANILACLASLAPTCRFLQASSSEVFGNSPDSPLRESSPRRPRNNYGISKVLGDNIVTLARERDGMFAISAFLFNHESPRRPLDFVTRKITRAAAEIALGRRASLELANLDAARDWGYAGDYVQALRLALSHSQPEDYVIATGRLHTVRDVCATAFSSLGLDYRNHVRESANAPQRFEPRTLVGDYTKIRSQLGWEPTTDFRALIELMTAADLDELASFQGG